MPFSIPRRVGTEQTDNFYFLSFSFFSELFWLKIKPKCNFFNFVNFSTIFLEFSTTRRVGTERNGTIIFNFFLSQPPSTCGGLKWSHYGIFHIFLNFFAIFLEFSIKRRVGTEQNDKFYFLSFSAFSLLFWLEIKR